MGKMVAVLLLSVILLLCPFIGDRYRRKTLDFIGDLKLQPAEFALTCFFSVIVRRDEVRFPYISILNRLLLCLYWLLFSLQPDLGKVSIIIMSGCFYRRKFYSL